MRSRAVGLSAWKPPPGRSIEKWLRKMPRQAVFQERWYVQARAPVVVNATSPNKVEPLRVH